MSGEKAKLLASGAAVPPDSAPDAVKCMIAAGTPRPPDGDPLLEIAPRDYFRVLVGREPNRAGKLRCPLHPDHTPSLRRPLPKDQQMGQFSGSALARGRK